MDTRWLRVLVELADRGTLREVAATTGYSASAVSQHLASLQRELGVRLTEPVGRLLALTPEGRAFVPHARAALAAVEAARGELAPEGPLVGSVRVAGYVTSIRRHILPAFVSLRSAHPGLEVQIEEREPDEVRELLARDRIDLGVVYDHSLVPRSMPASPFTEAPMLLAVPAGERRSATAVIDDPSTRWITNSRAADDDHLIGIVTSVRGGQPLIEHRIDSIELLLHLVQAGIGCALVAADAVRESLRSGVELIDVSAIAGTRRAYTLVRPGRERWKVTAALVSAIHATGT